ncbi:MAG: ABC transporter permease, partial [Planctomycetes bacterium]|nr:ABC transporter permease [Planctomycetota bacterium]
LVGITLATFLVLDWLPIDRERARVESSMEHATAEARAAAVREMRVAVGMIDAETGRPVPWWRRYLHWVEHAACFDFRATQADAGAFRARFGRALAVSALLGLLAVTLAVGLGLLIGTWSGMRPDSAGDRMVSNAVLLGFSLPEFLTATLLLLLLGGGLGGPWLPAGGLTSEGAGAWSRGAQWLDLAAHLAMPVTTLALVPLAIVVRHVRAAVVRATRSEFVNTMRNWGASEREIRRALFRHGAVPLATLFGTLLPSIVGGTVVVEQAFAIPGMGRMAFEGVLDKDVGVVMAITLLVSCATLLALTISDVLHRAVDPRVELR